MRQRPASRKAGQVMRAGSATKLGRWRLAAAAGGLALLTAACGASSSSASGGTASGTPSPSAPSSFAPSSSAPAAAGSSPGSALCAGAAALFTSLNQLTHIKVQKGAKNEITAKLTDVKANLTAFVTEARGQWQAQTAALKSALTNLQTAVKSLTASPSASAVGGVVTALGGVSAATQSLLAAVSTRCPSASPSPSG
jgi:hypothetical protein